VTERPRALLFDLDGTLVDSRRDIAASCNAALVAVGRAPLSLPTILAMVGDGARARAASGSASALEIEGALASFKAHYLAHPCVHAVLLPGAREVLEEARAQGLACALVTNKPRDVTLALVDALGIAHAFAALWGGGDGPLKPAPDSVLAMVAQLGIAARDAWMIGDGPQDIGAGKAAGCFTVGVPGIAEHERLLESAPDLVVPSLLELRDQLRLRARPA
jgi:phosphoglycolate phosphatase